MKKVLQKSAIVFLALMLIMATGGFSVYHHFCRCEGEITESIFLEADCDHTCDVAHETAICCATGETSSCCSAGEEAGQKAGPHSNDCCDSSSSFFKIQDNFRVSIEKVSLKFIAGLVKVLTGINFVSESTARAFALPAIVDTSPPLYGTELLHHIHQLKLDQPLV
jgi:hypothetical protein